MLMNKTRYVAIVDDDAELTTLLRETFEAQGFVVSTFPDALPFLRRIREAGLPHLVLIDLKLPSMHGFQLSQRLKALADVPIIFISKDNQTNTIIEGLAKYADDYVCKPFDERELVARAQRVLSRLCDFDYARAPILQIDAWLSIDFGNSRVWAGDEIRPLTRIEANILHILIRNAGRVVNNDTLIARVWPRKEVYEETLRVHMHRLRHKLEPDVQCPKYIQTIRGIGYRFMLKTTHQGEELAVSSANLEIHPPTNQKPCA